ncbi:uncharacterized protein FIBRA_06819 [Fibroporia radiculosa]|uniref:Fungal-type protein kinase domain-containing protein n=1 Tax=Fibroporia radiculosa TaxID=599839 RepID=J4GTL3_9APHY|nr:uncharacterized protein FIBRA_06819 [Fibroporia radiculosa]CCM04635.1 predicted protein [Fibroporia radiculosa]
MNPNLEPKVRSLVNTHFMEAEADVNGFWNAVLNIYFPTNTLDFITAPEANPKVGSGSRTDLLVRKYTYGANNTVTRRPVLLYEGKAHNGENMDAIRAQVSDYLKNLGDLKSQEKCWVIGARGREVSFWCFTKGVGGKDPLEQWGVNVKDHKVGPMATKVSYDVLNNFSSQSRISWLPIVQYFHDHPLGP